MKPSELARLVDENQRQYDAPACVIQGRRVELPAYRDEQYLWGAISWHLLGNGWVRCTKNSRVRVFRTGEEAIAWGLRV